MKRAHAESRRRATNLSLDEKLVAEARELELNVSRIVEDRAGFEAFERFVERNGIFNEDEREW